MIVKVKKGVRYFKGVGAQALHMKARAIETPREDEAGKHLTHRQKMSRGWIREAAGTRWVQNKKYE